MLVPVRSTTDRSAVAIGYAAETKLMNRTMTFIGLAGVLAAMFIGLVNSLATGHYKGGAAHLALLAGIAELKARAERADIVPHHRLRIARSGNQPP